MKSLLAALVAGSLGLGTAWAAQDPPAGVVQIDIRAQPLDDALNEFARQTGLQVFFLASDDSRRLISTPLTGSLEPEGALARLLANTGLSYEYIDARTVAIRSIRPAAATTGVAPISYRSAGAERSIVLAQADAAPASSSTQSVEKEPEEIIVRGVRFYQPTAGRAASKMDLPLIETPLSVSVVTSEQMEARSVDSLEQAFRYSAGIYSLGGGANRRNSTGFVVRGFNVTGSAPLYVNGSKFPINSTSGAMEPYLYESVELLKGPGSVLYGQTPPGGLINMVSKRPTAEPLYSLKAQVGSWNHRQVNVDVGGPLTEGGTLGYRVTGLVRDGETMIEQIPDERTAVSAALDWAIADSTKLTLLATYHDTNTAFDHGKPFDGSVLPNVNGRIDRETFVGEPGFDKFNPRGKTLGYLFEHKFNDTWQVRQNVLAFDYKVDFAGIEVGSATDVATRRLVNRFPYMRADADKGWSVDNQVQAKWTHGRFEHTTLAGFDYSDRDFERVQRSGTVTPLDVYAPVYGATVVRAATTARQLSDSTQLGIYLQDHIKFDGRWMMLIGGRWDDTKSDNLVRSAAGVTTPSKIESDAFTKRVGFLYLSDIGLAPYVSYAESFQPLGGTSFSGTPFDPTEGIQYEAGVKFEPKGHNAAFTAAVYELTQQNNLTMDLAHPGFSVQAGEIRARGVELEGRIAFGESLDLIASYTHTDAEVIRSNGADLGRTPASVPDNTASLWADYHYRVGTQGELSVGAGLRYIGETLNTLNTVTVPSYKDYDLSVRYDTQRWRFAFNIKNVLDEKYVSACTFACFYGDERNVSFSTQFTW
ncbi:TonB-dependent siderophore receptor [Steroidobacter sp.]|uniref:TonB-dependent siderophore receptor n=1 Tax=Steroidobacter sp. TaxID=1978227 RepID=UPI001A408D87|nr:TonB-dependent siderophore receptor [Steroidobacter sp.]MBL8267772.1 TonB-dependent siderophore receptor [Steroidobacter sp.]